MDVKASNKHTHIMRIRNVRTHSEMREKKVQTQQRTPYEEHNEK